MIDKCTSTHWLRSKYYLFKWFTETQIQSIRMRLAKRIKRKYPAYCVVHVASYIRPFSSMTESGIQARDRSARSTSIAGARVVVGALRGKTTINIYERSLRVQWKGDELKPLCAKVLVQSVVHFNQIGRQRITQASQETLIGRRDFDIHGLTISGDDGDICWRPKSLLSLGSNGDNYTSLFSSHSYYFYSTPDFISILVTRKIRRVS